MSNYCETLCPLGDVVRTVELKSMGAKLWACWGHGRWALMELPEEREATLVWFAQRCVFPVLAKGSRAGPEVTGSQNHSWGCPWVGSAPALQREAGSRDARDTQHRADGFPFERELTAVISFLKKWKLVNGF